MSGPPADASAVPPMAPSAPGWEVTLELPDAASAEVFAAALADLVPALASFEIEDSTRWRVTGYDEFEPEAARVGACLRAAATDAGLPVPDFAIVRLGDIDWVAEVERTLAPIHVAPFYIFGSHVTDPPPPGAIPIQVEAGLAFGTGNHGTTQGCLMALGRLWPDADAGPVNPLDVGTGSGLLAIAAAKRYGVAVVAGDIDPVAVRVARENAVINGVADLVDPVTCAGLEDEAIRARGPYDLIFANIVANPLIALAPDIAGALTTDGKGQVILSGILDIQRDAVAAAYEAAGLCVTDEIPIKEWVTLVLARG